MAEFKDSYLTIAEPAEAIYKERSSKFLTYAYPVESDIDTYTRSAVLENGVITLEDDVKLNNAGEIAFTFLTVKAPENVTENSFTLQGKTVTFDPSLEMTVEELTCDWPEVNTIHVGWETDVMRRIILKSKEPTKGKKYVLTVK